MRVRSKLQTIPAPQSLPKPMPVQSTVGVSTPLLIPTSFPDTVQNSCSILPQPNLSPYIESGALYLEPLHLSTRKLKDEKMIPENIPDTQPFPILSLTMVPNDPVTDMTLPGSHPPSHPNNVGSTEPVKEEQGCGPPEDHLNIQPLLPIPYLTRPFVIRPHPHSLTISHPHHHWIQKRMMICLLYKTLLTKA